MINQRISKLRDLMKKEGINAYIVPSEDFHQSEYVGEFFKSREYISGFNGSAGAAVVTETEALLWTDGRYFLQAEIQLSGSEFKLQKMGVEGVPTIEEYLEQNLSDSACIGVDGRTISVNSGESYENLAKSKNGSVKYDLDLIGQIWDDRPSLSKEKAFFLEEKYSGESSVSKVKRIREQMAKKGANTHVICALDDICWMINSRGNDVAYCPLILSYAVLTMDELHLFVDSDKFDEKIMKNLNELNTKFHPYDEIYDFVKKFDKDNSVLLDTSKMNYALYKNIPCEAKIIESQNPAILFKALKNETEIENIKEAHVKDGLAWVRFHKWLEENIGKIEITEISASDKLESFRAEFDSYLWPSFAPISGYGKNAAIVHYSASEETNTKLEPRGLYLADTGGNYYEGSTDITRTVVLGELTKEEKEHFTLVFKGHARLAKAIFLEGSSGFTLDILTRKPMWDRGLDYKHGTGHGVGYLLNVHEGPAGIRYHINPAKNEHAPLQAGMVITDEPGLYIANSHGIRIESELIVVKHQKTEYGQFYKFEPCTYAPIDLKAIDVNMLNDEEREFLNDYHKLVFDKLSPHLNDEEKEWLKHNTREI